MNDIIPETAQRFSKEFIDEVVQYCLDCGTGIQYKKTNDDGSENFTTDAEHQRAAASHDNLRYVQPETVDWFLSGEILPKTKHILELKRQGQHIDLIDFDEWVAICKILDCDELTLDEAYKINGALWNHDISPMELVGEHELICSDGYSIERTVYPSEALAVEAMKKAYNEFNINAPGDEWDEMSHINDSDALLYDRGENVYVWSVMPYGKQ